MRQRPTRPVDRRQYRNSKQANTCQTCHDWEQWKKENVKLECYGNVKNGVAVVGVYLRILDSILIRAWLAILKEIKNWFFIKISFFTLSYLRIFLTYYYFFEGCQAELTLANAASCCLTYVFSLLTYYFFKRCQAELTLAKAASFTITSLNYFSCSDVLLNQKQSNSELQNVVASLFTVRFRLSRLWSVYWVNIYHWNPCFDARMTSRMGHPLEY